MCELLVALRNRSNCHEIKGGKKKKGAVGRKSDYGEKWEGKKGERDIKDHPAFIPKWRFGVGGEFFIAATSLLSFSRELTR